MPLPRPLYVYLEVAPDASQEEIRLAFHRLASRHYADTARGDRSHPKPTCTGERPEEEFKQILAAFTVLSDPDAREVYDRYGEQGLTNLEAIPAMAEVAHVINAVLFFRTTFALLSLLSALMVVFLIFIAVKVDKDKGWSWVFVASPAFVASGLVAAVLIFSIVYRIKKYVQWYRECATGMCPADVSGRHHQNFAAESVVNVCSNGNACPNGTSRAEREANNHPALCAAASGPSFSASSRTATTSPAANPSTGTGVTSNESASTLATVHAVRCNKYLVHKQLSFWIRHLTVFCGLISFAMICDCFQYSVNGEEPRVSWWVALGPALAVAFLSIASTFQMRDALRLRGLYEVCNVTLCVLNGMAFLLFACRVAQVLVLALQLHGVFAIGARKAAVPTFCYLVIRYANVVIIEASRVRSVKIFLERRRLRELNNVTTQAASTNTPPSPPPTPLVSDSNSYFSHPSFVVQIGIETFTHLMLFLLAGLVCGRADGADISMTSALTPGFILFGFFFLVFAGLYSCFAIYRPEKGKDRPHAQQQKSLSASGSPREAPLASADNRRHKLSIRSNAYEDNDGAEEGASDFELDVRVTAPPPAHVVPHVPLVLPVATMTLPYDRLAHSSRGPVAMFDNRPTFFYHHEGLAEIVEAEREHQLQEMQRRLRAQQQELRQQQERQPDTLHAEANDFGHVTRVPPPHRDDRPAAAAFSDDEGRRDQEYNYAYADGIAGKVAAAVDQYLDEGVSPMTPNN